MHDAQKLSGFKELKAKLDALPNQTVGSPSAICETGEPYVEFSEFALARPHDIAVVESYTASRLGCRVLDYFQSRGGRIFWRVPLEWAVDDLPQVVRFDENGPDKDFATGRLCVLDKNWKAVKGYCRVYKATYRSAEDP